MHVALLAVLVFGFAHAPRFDDAAESIPVETVTTAQLNQIMEGEKTAKPSPAKPAPAPPKAEPVPLPPTPPQPTPEPPKPPPPEPPTPPPPPEPPTPPEPPEPEPPPPEPPMRPEPPKPEPPKPQAEDAPRPPERPRPEKPVETPRPPERPRRTQQAAKPDKFRPDEIAKALAREKAQEKPRRSASTYDPKAIAKLIGQSKVAEAQPNAAPRQGLANRHSERNAPQMSQSQNEAFNKWLTESYNSCWILPPTHPEGENYEFKVHVTLNSDGSLAARPVMLNPPPDPRWQAHADSVIRAVMRCNPLHVPTEFSPFFEQWRSLNIRFDPASMDG
jgi:hypothetical protein